MILNYVLEYLKELNFISIFLRLSMAVLFGGIIGYGREKEKRPAGLRTHILVSVGSTLVMITNFYIYEYYGGNTDPTRLGAQVISGIGFLGAGTIIVTGKNKVRGLTTAAGLWASACMGLALGAGFYIGAIIGCIFILLVTVVLAKVDKKLDKVSKNITIYIFIKSINNLPLILSDIKIMEIKLIDFEINNYSKKCDLVGVLLGLRIPNKISHKDFIKVLEKKEEVLFLQEIV